MAVALAFAGGSASVAAAKRRAARPAHPAATQLLMAHAAGHKIA
jgi:hypothetical protein